MQPPHDKEWRSLALNPVTDIPLYRSPRHAPGNNARLHRGTDVFAHAAPGGSIYFYLWHWSMCDSKTDICQLTTADSAKHFIREQVCGREVITGLEHEHLMEYLPGLYWDTDAVHRD